MSAASGGQRRFAPCPRGLADQSARRDAWARGWYLDSQMADTQLEKSESRPQTPSPPLAGGPTNRWREAAAIFGEGVISSAIERPALLPLPEFAVVLRTRQIRPSLEGKGWR